MQFEPQWGEAARFPRVSNKAVPFFPLFFFLIYQNKLSICILSHREKNKGQGKKKKPTRKKYHLKPEFAEVTFSAEYSGGLPGTPQPTAQLG